MFICPYTKGQIVYAQYYNKAWLLSRIVDIDRAAGYIKLKAIHDLASSFRRYGDRIRLLSDEEAMLVLLEN